METVCGNRKLKSRRLCQKSRLYIHKSKWQTPSVFSFFPHCKEPITIFSFIKLTQCPAFMGIKFWNVFCNSKDKGRNLHNQGHANKQLHYKSSSQRLQHKFWFGISPQPLCRGGTSCWISFPCSGAVGSTAKDVASVHPACPSQRGHWHFPWNKQPFLASCTF